MRGEEVSQGKGCHPRVVVPGGIPLGARWLALVLPVCGPARAQRPGDRPAEAGLPGRREAGIMSVREGGRENSPSLIAEEIIAILRKQPALAPLCWIVCYEDRPLQGRPPDSSESHLLIFTSVDRAQGFIAGRLRFYEPEPLSVVGVDTAQRLKDLVMAPGRDPRYKPPPFGLLLNFAYPTGATDEALSPQQTAEMAAGELVRALGLTSAADEELIDAGHCLVCQKELNYERWVSGIMFGSQFEEMIERGAYRCRHCGAPICMSCARISVCPHCGGKVFDRAVGEPQPVPPSAAARETESDRAAAPSPLVEPVAPPASVPPALVTTEGDRAAASAALTQEGARPARLPLAPAKTEGERTVASTAVSNASAPAVPLPTGRRRLPRWAWGVGVLLVGVLVVIGILIGRQVAAPGIPGIDAPIKMEDGTVRVTGAERTDSFTQYGQTVTARPGQELVFVAVEVKGTVPLAGVGGGVRNLLNGDWALTDGDARRYLPVGLVAGRLGFEVQKPATGLVLWLGVETGFPLGGFFGEEVAQIGVPSPMATSSPMPMALPVTATASAPTATATAILPSPTPGRASPRAGAWAGEGASFVVTEDGRVQNLVVSVRFQASRCTLTADREIAIVEGEFEHQVQVPAELGEFTAAIFRGTFVEDTTLVGTYSVSFCLNQLVSPAVEGEWVATWQGAAPTTPLAATAVPPTDAAVTSGPEAGTTFSGVFEGGSLAFGIGRGGASVEDCTVTIVGSVPCSEGGSISGVEAQYSFSSPIVDQTFQYQMSAVGGIQIRGRFENATGASGTLEMTLAVQGGVCSIGPLDWRATVGSAGASPTPDMTLPGPTTPVAGILPPPPEPFACPAPRVNDFASAGGFGTGSADWARWGLSSGEYSMAMKQPNSWGWQSDGVKMTDAVIEVDVRQAAKGSGTYGLVLGADSLDNGQRLYAFVIDANGYFGLFRHTQAGDWMELEPFTYSWILFQGGRTNQLKVVRSGPLIGLYGNDIPLTMAIYDAAYTGAGYAGLVAWSNETAGLEARFDNYRVCTLAEPYPLPVHPFAQKRVRWPAGQPAVLHWTWFATTAPLAQSFADLAEIALTIDGQTFSGLGEYWGTPEPYARGYAIQWNLPLPALEPGSHRIETTISLSEQVTDGFDENGDGKKDLYGPGEVSSGWVELQLED